VAIIVNIKILNYTLLWDVSICLLPVELHKINYRHLPIQKFKRYLNLNFNSYCHKF